MSDTSTERGTAVPGRMLRPVLRPVLEDRSPLSSA
jgi:hypothetical protein